MSIKRGIAFLTLCILAVIPYGCVADGGVTDIDSIRSYKDIPGVTAEEIAAVESLKMHHGRFSYGHVLETEAFLKPDGTYAGFTIEMCKLLSDLFDADFTPVCYDAWKDMKAALDSGALDFSGGFTQTEERLRTYLMSAPVAGRSLKTYTLKSRNITTAGELEGGKIGSLDGTALMGTLLKTYPELSFTQVAIDSYAEGVDMLESGELDAILATSAAAPILDIYDSIEAGALFELSVFPISITAANRAYEPIISVIDKYLDAGGGKKIFDLYKAGELEYKKTSLRNSLTADEARFLADMLARNAKVDIGLQHDAYPASFYNEAEKEFQGVSIDILKQITLLTGLEFETLSTSTDTTLAVILEKLKTGEIQMMTQLLRTESRKNDYIWSDVPYLTTNYALLSRIDYPDVDIFQVRSERVGTVDKSAHEVMFDLWFPDHEHRIVYTTTLEAFNALENGEIDLLMLSENMLLQQTNLYEKTKYKTNLKFNQTLNSYFGFSKSSELLRSIVDKSMSYIDIGTIADRWMNRVFDYSGELSRIRTVFLLILSAAALVALVVVASTLRSNRRLSKSLETRTTTLSAIYESIPDVIFCKDTEGAYTSCNPGFEECTGFSESEILGKTFPELFKSHTEEEAVSIEEMDSRVVRERTTEKYEETIVYPDGKSRLFETLKAPMVKDGTVVGLLGVSRDVTERKEIKSRLDRIINTAQFIFLLTVDGIVTEANEYSQNTIGARIGDDIREFYCVPEERGELLGLAELYGTASGCIVRIKMKNGEIHRLLVSVTSVEYEQRKAYVVWGMDIEKDEIRNDQLRVTQLSFQIILDTLPMPVRIVDIETGEIMYTNGSMLELLEYSSPEALRGKNILDLMPEVFRDGTPAAQREKILLDSSDADDTLEMEYLTRTGKLIEAAVVARHIDYKGRRSSIGIIKDLTQEKERSQVLLDLVDREREANQSKNLFLANMSHEIRTPMNGIIGMADLLSVEKLSHRQAEYVKEIKNSAVSLLGIINDLLDLSKITDGKLQIVPADIDLNMTLKNITSMMSFTASTKGLNFVEEIHIASPTYAYVDDLRLSQILVNLLSNAIKFTEKGQVSFTAKIADGEMSFEVSDTGIGIRDEDISLIFSAFSQVDRQKNRHIKGTGLGLSITKNLVELMNGRIWLESEYGVGTTFYVTIPFEKGDESKTEAVQGEFRYIFAPGANILLVDDIQTNLMVGAGLLRLCGITADVATSGYEAIELVRSKDYDIVFMDHMMPEMDGIETMEFIRGMGGKYKDLPIIALTANAVTDSKALLLASGMDDFLSKPIDKVELNDILKKWLPEYKIEQASASDALTGQDVGYSEVLSSASKIEGLDIKLALNRIGGIQEVLETSLRQTAYEIKSGLKEMKTDLSSENLQNFAIKAHGLKGALANIGAMQNSELAAELEIAAKAGNLALCAKKFPVFSEVLEGFAVLLNNIFPTGEKSERAMGDAALMSGKAAEAIELLESFEAAEALERLGELAAFTFGERNDTLLGDAKRAAQSFSYEKAVALLRELDSSF